MPREPDLTIDMRNEPFHVPSTGTVRYQFFVTDSKFTEDRWIQAAEIVPGNPSVVHHVIVFAVQDLKRLDGFRLSCFDDWRTAAAE